MSKYSLEEPQYVNIFVDIFANENSNIHYTACDEGIIIVVCNLTDN